jgi:hypothetical protein
LGDIAEESKEMTARIFLASRSFSVGGCSMRITEDVRKSAAEQKLSEKEALRAGMEQKAKEFVSSGADLYAKS